MTIWIIEPRDPLIVRDGRPFGPDPGARATSLPFPFPSTTTGGVRTRTSLNAEGLFEILDRQQVDALKEVRVRGPFLVQLADDGHDIEEQGWLVPGPADALFVEGETRTDDTTTRLRQLVPLQLLEGAQTDFAQKSQENLWLVGLPVAHYEKKKPLRHTPSFWYWEMFQSWLLNPVQLHDQAIPISALGLNGLLRDRRLHVSIDASKEVAKEGMLFETSGLEFTMPGSGNHRLHNARRLALVVAVDDAPDNHHALTLRSGLAGFAGERRIVTWRESSKRLPGYPGELLQAIIASHACRIVLLTPACFEQGYRPTWLQKEARHYGVTTSIRAIAVQHPQVVSGWDLHLKKPKPSRFLAPAGTVLFLSLQGSEAAISRWLEDTWMHCISDDEQDRRDGFGLAVVGTWSGQPVAME